MLDAPETPTTAIYVTGSLDGLIGRPGETRFPVWRLTANVFYMRGPSPAVLVVRNWDRGARRRLARLAPAPIHYLLDDDIWAGADDPQLPESYRRKLSLMAQGPVRALLDGAAKVYAPSGPLLARMIGETGGRAEGSLVRPALVTPVASLSHHDDGARPLEIVFPATRSHLGDLAAVAPDIARFLAKTPAARLHTFLGRHAPDELRLANAIHHRPLTFAQYREMMAARRFHIALAPCLPTAFNAARSPNRILEYASFGAAPIYGDTYPHAETVARHGAGRLCPMEPGAWFEILRSMAGDRARLRAIAAANRELALASGAASEQRRFWMDAFGLAG